MEILFAARDAITTQTIVNCFWKSGIFGESKEADTAEDDNPFQELQDEVDDFRSVQRDFMAKIFFYKQ